MKRKPVNKLSRLQLDRQLEKIRSVILSDRPLKGWIRTIREALGMTTTQFAKRAGMVQSRVSVIESGEINDVLTLRTLKIAAKTLNCRFVYFLIPEKSLQETVEKQARKTAERTSKNVAHSMALENQSLNNEGIEDFLKIQTEEILQKQLNKIWDRE